MTVQVAYLSHDAMTEGVGASQVLAYVERLPALGIEVTLHSFEKGPPDPAVADRLQRAGARWAPHGFGRYGAVGGLGRIARGARAARGAPLVHARADLAAASALVARPRAWVWDCRGLYADQRIELGLIARGSAEHRVLQRVEGAAARRADGVVTLTRAVVPVLEERHGPGVARKIEVIPTCVDLGRFPVAPLPAGSTRFLLAGTINRYYDVPAMVALVRAFARRRLAELTVVAPDATSWDAQLAPVETARMRARHDEMPAVIHAHHVGLSVCRDDAGVSLLGSMPTKLAEILACGRPVVVNARLGDAGDLVRSARCGVVLDAVGGSVEDAADELEALLAEPDLAERCRAVAEEHFDLDAGVARLARLYERVSRESA